MIAAARLPLRNGPANSQFECPWPDLILDPVIVDGYCTTTVDHLAVITGNSDFIAEAIAELIARCELEEEGDPED
jgi:hypothetical protein